MITHYRRAAFGLAAITAAVSLSGCGVNTIPTKEETAKQAWADVQAQYQRRADLIPNLVATDEICNFFFYTVLCPL